MPHVQEEELEEKECFPMETKRFMLVEIKPFGRVSRSLSKRCYSVPTYLATPQSEHYLPLHSHIYLPSLLDLWRGHIYVMCKVTEVLGHCPFLPPLAW